MNRGSLPRSSGEPSTRPSGKLDSLTDADCLVRVAGGDTTAFTEIVRRYQGRIVNLVYRLVGDWDAALDLAQEAFLRVHRRAVTFRPEGNARSWLLTVAANIARDYLRSRPRIIYLERVVGDRAVGVGGLRADPTTPPQFLDQEERRNRVHGALAKMQESHRTVLVLRDFEGFSYEEMTRILGCQLGTVKSRVHRARAHFEEVFRSFEPDHGRS